MPEGKSIEEKGRSETSGGSSLRRCCWNIKKLFGKERPVDVKEKDGKAKENAFEILLKLHVPNGRPINGSLWRWAWARMDCYARDDWDLFCAFALLALRSQNIGYPYGRIPEGLLVKQLVVCNVGWDVGARSEGLNEVRGAFHVIHKENFKGSLQMYNDALAEDNKPLEIEVRVWLPERPTNEEVEDINVEIDG